MDRFFKNGQTVLFQGDSVTDCGRSRDDDSFLGDGYAGKIASVYNALFPYNGVKFVNRGVSGNRVHNLIERYVEDFMDVAPDFISILIGINDVWRRYDSNDPSTQEAFRDHYEYLLKMIKHHMPDTKIMIMEPFVLHTLPDRKTWHEDLDPKIQIIRELAAEYAHFYLPLDGIFASYCASSCKAEDIAPDGVHPSDFGHSIIASEYIKMLGIL